MEIKKWFTKIAPHSAEPPTAAVCVIGGFSGLASENYAPDKPEVRSFAKVGAGLNL